MGARIVETQKEWNERIKDFFVRGRIVKTDCDGGKATFLEIGKDNIFCKCVNADGKIDGVQYANLITLNVPRKEVE